MYSKAELLEGIPIPPPVALPKKKILAPVKLIRGYAYERRRRANPSKPHSRSGLFGVIHCPNLKVKTWKAYVSQDGKYVTIGYYATKEEAAAAYNKRAKEIHGDKAHLNPV